MRNLFSSSRNIKLLFDKIIITQEKQWRVKKLSVVGIKLFRHFISLYTVCSVHHIGCLIIQIVHKQEKIIKILSSIIWKNYTILINFKTKVKFYWYRFILLVSQCFNWKHNLLKTCFNYGTVGQGVLSVFPLICLSCKLHDQLLNKDKRN